MGVHRVTCSSCPWVAECDHGKAGVWVIHRHTEWAARRSLRAHQRECEYAAEDDGRG